MRRGLTALAALILAVSTAACVSGPQVPSDCAAASVERHVTLTAQTLDPRNVDVCRGQQVALTVEPQVDGVLHIHGYDEEARSVRAGKTLDLDFTADHSGQFVIELHTDAQPAGIGVGVFTVHER